MEVILHFTISESKRPEIESAIKALGITAGQVFETKTARWGVAYKAPKFTVNADRKVWVTVQKLKKDGQPYSRPVYREYGTGLKIAYTKGFYTYE